MGPNFEITNVEAINGGTSIQIDGEYERQKIRLFVSTREFFKALNNHLYEAEDLRLESQGWEKEDPDAPNHNLIV